MVDGATHKKEGYLDVRISFGLQGKVHNVHLLAIPTGHSAHTGENYAEFVLNVLKDIDNDEGVLLKQLIGISTDGAATMLGRHQGFSTRVRAAAESQGNPSITINWCGSHQLNLAVDAFLKVLDCKVKFRKRLGSDISFTRRYETVRFSVGLCPSYATTRWESIYDACHFLAKHYGQLVAAQAAKTYTKSSNEWRLCLFVVSEISEWIRCCFRKLQIKTVTMREQYVALDELVHTLQLKYESDSDDGDVHIDSSKVAHHLQWCSFSSMSLFEGMHADNSPHESAQVRTSEQEQNSEAPGLYTEEFFMPDNENEQYENEFEEDAWCTEVEQDMTEDVNQNLSWNELVQTFAEAVTVFIKSVSHIRLDIHKDVREEPPTRPIDVVRCSDKTYRALLVAQTAKLEARFGFTATQDIWNQRKCLIQCYTKKGDCRRKIKENEYAPLQQGWDEVAAFGNFEMVCNFTIGLASIAPGTHTVEGDFSTLKRVMGLHRGRLSNYAMEGELQARQYFQLMSLANEVGSDEAHEALE